MVALPIVSQADVVRSHYPVPMKGYRMQVYRNVLTDAEISGILSDILQKYPHLATGNYYKEFLDVDFPYLMMLPKIISPDLDGLVTCCVVLSTVYPDQNYAGAEWHYDGPSDETSVLLYLQGDPNSGGKFLTETGEYQFEPGTAFLLPADVSHMVTPYDNKLARIALKWLVKSIKN
jgi:hypothetical protein